MANHNSSVYTSDLLGGFLDLFIENSLERWMNITGPFIPIVALIFVTIWIVATMFQRWRRRGKEWKLSQENIDKCHAAIQIVISRTLPCLQNVIDAWHQQAKQRLPPCSTPTVCLPNNKKPSPKINSCPECISWAKAIEAEVFPSKMKGSLQWKNANPSLFATDPLEVMKLFAFQLVPNKTISTLGDFDAGSLLKIMSKFSDFHQGSSAVAKAIDKVADIRNALAHFSVGNNLNLDDQTFHDYWDDIADLVNCIHGLKHQYFTDHTAQAIKTDMTRICKQSNSAEILRLVEKLVEDRLGDFMKDLTDKTSSKDAHLDLETCQKKLKEMYKSRRGGIGFLPGLPKKLSSDEFFVDLQLLKEQHTPTEIKHVELKTYTDLLKIQDSQGKNLQHVMVSGLAGTGKTTVVSRLAYQWATIRYDHLQTLETNNNEQPHPLSRFQLVLAIDIRKFKPDMDLVDTIQDQLLQYTSKQALESYLLANADKCLFLFDGYDELGSELASNEIVLGSNMLCGAHVILTSRPNKVDQFYELHQESVYVQVELKGFSEMHTAQFVKQFFKHSHSQDNEARQLLQTINGTSFLKSFSHFPLLLAMMCLLWKDKKCMPKSITTLYHQLIEYLAKQLKVRIPTFDSSYSSCKHLLIRLGKTGFAGLSDENTKLIFREDEFDSVDDIENGCRLGLMTRNSKVSGFDKITEVSFIHKTFQEFCSAIYLCSMYEDNPQQQLKFKRSVDDWENVLKFCCGEDYNFAKDVLSQVVDLSCASVQNFQKKNTSFGIGRMHDPWKLPLVLLFEIESQYGFDETLHNLIKPLVSYIALFDLKPFTSHYRSVLEHYISASRTQNKWLRFVRTANIYPLFSPDKDIQMLTHMTNLSTLNIAGRCDCSGFITAIQGKIFSLRMLDIVDCVCDTAALHTLLVTNPNLTMPHIPFNPADKSTDVDVLGKVLDVIAVRLGSIRSLSIRKCDISQILPNIQANWHTLERLELIQTRTSNDNWHELFEMMIKIGEETQRKTSLEGDIPNRSKAALPLKYLDLCWSCIGDSSFKLAEALKYTASLEYLGLSSNNYDKSNFSRISKSLCNMPEGLHLSHNNIWSDGESLGYTPQLKSLELANNDIGSEGAVALSESLQYTPQLKSLELASNNIGSEGAVALSASLRYTPELNWLELANNNIGSEGAITISASLQYIQKLTRLDLTHNNIGSDGAKVLLALFQYTPKLYTLELANNDIGSDGATALSVSLQYTPELTWLDLSHNNIGSDGAVALSASLQYTPELTQLDLSNNNIGSGGVVALSESFQYATQIHSLHLANNNIGSDGAVALSATFHKLLVQSLQLDNNPIGPDGALAIFRNLYHLCNLSQPSLQSIYALLNACMDKHTIDAIHNQCAFLQSCIELFCELIALQKTCIGKSASHNSNEKCIRSARKHNVILKACAAQVQEHYASVKVHLDALHEPSSQHKACIDAIHEEIDLLKACINALHEPSTCTKACENALHEKDETCVDLSQAQYDLLKECVQVLYEVCALLKVCKDASLKTWIDASPGMTALLKASIDAPPEVTALIKASINGSHDEVIALCKTCSNTLHEIKAIQNVNKTNLIIINTSFEERFALHRACNDVVLTMIILRKACLDMSPHLKAHLDHCHKFSTYLASIHTLLKLLHKTMTLNQLPVQLHHTN